VAVKAAKPRHDFRFDIPCVGPNTVETCAGAGVAVLALEPGKALVLEKPQVELLVRKLGVILTTVSPPES
jgi:DUF1009 family protein